MRFTAELTVRRTEPRGVFVPSLTVVGETTPEDEERLKEALVGVAAVMRGTAERIEAITE